MVSSIIKTLIRMRRSVERRLLGSWADWRQRMLETVEKNGHLGFVCFGGPPVHFQIVSTIRGLTILYQHLVVIRFNFAFWHAVPQEIRGEISMARRANVPRAICSHPGSLRPCEHEDAILY
jgi:hypothetical protein